MRRASWHLASPCRHWPLHVTSRLQRGEVQCRRAELAECAVADSSSRKRTSISIGVRNERLSIAPMRVSNPGYGIAVPEGTDCSSFEDQRDRAPFVCSDSGSSRIRFTADLASHSRAFCRNSAALCTPSFSFMRIWCVSMVLTLTFNSFASSDALSPLPINEKIASPRFLGLLISELPTLFAPAAKLLKIRGNTLAPTYGRPVKISSNAFSSSGASSIVRYPRAPARNAR